MVKNPRKGTARHEYFFSWLLLETVVGAKASLVAGFLIAADNSGRQHMYVAMLIMLFLGLGIGYACGRIDGQKKNQRYDK